MRLSAIPTRSLPIPCGYILQVKPDQAAKVTALPAQLPGVRVDLIAKVASQKYFAWRADTTKDADRFEIDPARLADAWRSAAELVITFSTLAASYRA